MLTATPILPDPEEGMMEGKSDGEKTAVVVKYITFTRPMAL